MKIQKFGEMRYGQWFKELGGKRIFVKLQNILPSGIPVYHDSFCARDTTLFHGEVIPQGKKINSMHFNAVDIDGIPACCPDWVEFELIKAPFKQLNHKLGKNMQIPRYDGEHEEQN